MIDPNLRLVGTDVETFGLDREDPILEVGVRIFDLDFHTVAQETVLVWEPHYRPRLERMEEAAAHGDQIASLVLGMHHASNLWYDAEHFGISAVAAEQYLLSFCNQWKITGLDPMFGSSVQADRDWLRAQMPNFERRFFYRNIDVSSFKETAARYNRKLLLDRPTPVGRHRTQEDIVDSANEYKWYLDNAFFVDRG